MVRHPAHSTACRGRHAVDGRAGVMQVMVELPLLPPVGLNESYSGAFIVADLRARQSSGTNLIRVSIEVEEVCSLASDLVETLGYRTVAGVAELFRDLSVTGDAAVEQHDDLAVARVQRREEVVRHEIPDDLALRALYGDRVAELYEADLDLRALRIELALEVLSGV